MECLAGTWNIVPCLWGCSDRHAKYIRDLEENLESLRSKKLTLKSLTEDASNRVREAEEQQMNLRNQVKDWRGRAVAMENRVDEILRKGDQELRNKCPVSCCPKNCWASYKIGKEVLKMIPRVTKLTEEGKFDVVADELPPPSVDEQPMDNVVVGFESKFVEVWQSVQNNDYPVIGLVGMGGVGKTTLLKQLNNEFLKVAHEYDTVIWIVVSKPANLGRIRDSIRCKLNIPDKLWENKSEDQRICLIFSKLKEKKFIVLLDDMWETLELSEVGIPRPSMDNMSKIVMTTRSREVCQSMGADKVIPVGCLLPDQAFKLFSSMLGEDILKSHPEMRELIMDVASECEGLPLALIVIGRAMRSKTDGRQWKEAKRTLEKYPAVFPGMEGGVFSKLVFSYDSLPNPMAKKCFEYCSLYPEDHNILEEEVIKLWLAEGFVGECDSMYDALIQGRHILESLKQACLLETGERSSRYFREEKTVKMHDVIRDMTLWIACERGKKKNKFYVEIASGDQDGITIAPNAMTNAEKIYLRGPGIITESLVGMSFCPNLATLIVQDTAVKELPGEIIHSMDVLKVLDLSGNKSLTLHIEDGWLKKLEYLNIVGTWTLVRLPAVVSQWNKLRFLIVDDMLLIPGGIISCLCSLQMFEQDCLTKHFIKDRDKQEERESMEREMLLELKGLKHIMDIRLTLYSRTGIEILLNSPKLQKCTTKLAVRLLRSSSEMLDFGTGTITKHLERLHVEYYSKSEIKLGRHSLSNSLSVVSFLGCHEIQNLSSLIYAPNLSVLSVDNCTSMAELIGKETRISSVGKSLFSSLTSLTLDTIPLLRSICPQSALPFPSLQVIKVYQCQSLRKLPLDSKTIPQEFIIYGEKKWCDELEWDSQVTKDFFTPKFVRLEF